MPRKGEAGGGGGGSGSRPSALPNARSMAWALLLLRLFVGAKFLQAGIDKWHWLGTNQLAAQLTKWTHGDSPAAYSSYIDFLNRYVMPHAPVFTYLVVLGEVAVGVCLILGLMSRLVALPALMMSINYLLATWNLGASYQGLNEAFIALELALLLTGAGRFGGLDANLAKTRPQWPLW